MMHPPKSPTKSRTKSKASTGTQTVTPSARTIIFSACGALAALLVLAVLAWYVTSRPVGGAMPAKPWHISADDRLVLYPAEAGPLLSIAGADREGIDVRFESARLDGDTLKSLHDDFALTLPASSGPIVWATAAVGTGHTTIDVDLRGVNGNSQVEVARTQEGPDPGLSLRARAATLVVHLGVLLGDSHDSHDSLHKRPIDVEQKALEFAGGKPVMLPGPVPLTVIVQPDRQLRLIFPSTKLVSSLSLGRQDPTGGRSGLALRGAAVGPFGGSADTLYACAAPEGSDYWRVGTPRIDECASDGKLRATQFELGRHDVAVTLHGSAWFATEGEFVTDQRYGKYVSSNAVLSVLIGAFVSAICAIVVTAIFGRS